jgi:Lon protease-like protein
VPVLPMFPLGTVLLPSAILPLHVFEDRYRALVQHCLDGDQRFGVVLIERGSEVGGGDARTDVGTIAQIIEAARFDDGRYALAAVGTERIRVHRWLDDDPYPRAEVSVLEDPVFEETDPDDSLDDALGALTSRLRRLLARYAELGESVPPATSELSEDPVLASYQAAVLAPLGPADKQRLLAAVSPAVRIATLAELIDEALGTLDGLQQLDQPPDDGYDPLEG